MNEPFEYDPAFPSSFKSGDKGTIHQGMSVRDYFAATAMNALIVADVMEAFRRNDYEGRQHHNTYVTSGPRDMAAAAYDYADAMLAERAKR